MNKAIKFLESVKIKSISESAITQEDSIFSTENQIGLVEGYLSANKLNKFIRANNFKAELGYANRGLLYLNVPVDKATLGPLSASIKSVYLQILISKFDKAGPNGEQYAVEGSFKYELNTGGSNGMNIPGVWYLKDSGELTLKTR